MIPSLISPLIRILVVGDIMLDQYYWTSVERISPEAPVPVCRMQRVTATLGGAANVANNIRAFGAKAGLVGVVGQDPHADTLHQLMTTAGMDATGVQAVASMPTICKTRVMGNGQQLCRIDDEPAKVDAQDSAWETRLIADLVARIQTVDAVVVSDYNKGMITPTRMRAIVDAAAKQNRPVIVDPKGSNPALYEGASFLTPNQREFYQLAGLDSGADADTVAQAAQTMIQTHRFQGLLVTRSHEGMSIYTPTAIDHVPTKARDVYDVSGAGDTVVAALAVGLASKWPIMDTVHFANVAAGVVVSKRGTATATLAEIQAYAV